MKEDDYLIAEAARLAAEVHELSKRLAQASGQAVEELPTAASKRVVRALRPPLPDPRMVRGIIRSRQLRFKYFSKELFADPAWDMLLDLAAARAEHRRVSITSLCIASEVPPTTALRWIGIMVEQGLFVRGGDPTDRRRAFVELSDSGTDAMARYFAEAGTRGHL